MYCQVFYREGKPIKVTTNDTLVKCQNTLAVFTNKLVNSVTIVTFFENFILEPNKINTERLVQITSFNSRFSPNKLSTDNNHLSH